MYKTAVIKDLAFNESGLLRLPRDLLDRLAFHLPPNDVALGLRLASRTLAAALCQPHHATIHLSHPVDLRAFAARWGCPGATQRLTLRQRLALLRLTSASGVLPNFLLLHKQRSFHRLSQRFDRERLWLDDSESSWWEDWEKPLDLCLKAAAGAGRLQMCRQLLQPGFLYGWCHDTEEVAGAASSAGHQEVVHLLLDAYKAAGGTPDLSVAALVGSVELGMEALTSCLSCLCAALRIAAKRGDEAMVEWLLQQQGHPGLEEWRLDEVGLAQAVAESCGLPYLQHLLVRWYRGQEGEGGAAAAAAAGQQLGSRKEAFQAALRGAAGSPKPDWKGKVEWLLQQDERQLLGVLAGQCKRDACIAAARCTDAAERLRWLAQQGFAVGCSKVACEAIAHGRTAAVEYLLDEQGVVLEREAGTEAVEQAALKGHLPVLQVLHERRYGMFSLAVERAVDRGHVEVVRWLLSVLPGPPSRHLSANAFTHAVLWEDWPMLQLLLRARCPLPLERQLAEGADPTEETLAWLADRGCCYSTVGCVVTCKVHFTHPDPVRQQSLLHAACF